MLLRIGIAWLCVGLAGCGAANPDVPLDLRGAYRLVITHESGSEAAEWVADYLAENLSGSAYLKVRRLPSHAPVRPEQQGDASIHIKSWVRIEQSDFYDSRRRNSLSCALGDIDCGRRYDSDFYNNTTLWGTLELTLLRAGFQAQERTIVDHIDRGPHRLLYERLARRVSTMLNRTLSNSRPD